MRCNHCGATIEASAIACPFCKVQTAFGVERQRQHEAASHAQAAWANQEAARQQMTSRAQLESLSGNAFAWSLGSVFLCCLPLGVVGLVQSTRARGLAKQFGLEVPFRGKMALVLSIVGSVLSVGMVTTALVSSHFDEEEAGKRIATLEKKIAKTVVSPTLDQGTACALSEIHLLQNGWDGHPGYSLEHFECIGKLAPRGTEGAALDGMRFRWSASQKYELNVCFKHGAKWYVTETRKDGCP